MCISMRQDDGLRKKFRSLFLLGKKPVIHESKVNRNANFVVLANEYEFHLHQIVVMNKKVCIVGAGPGGLACAMLLAKAGLQVTILERLPGVGGRTSSYRSDGFTFDVGPTFFLYPSVLREIFAACGFDLDREVSFMKLDPQYELIFGGGGRLAASPDFNRMEEAIRRLSPPDVQGFRRFYEDNRRKLTGFAPFLSSPFLGWSDLLRKDMLKLLPLLRPWRSVHSDMSRYFEDPRLRLAFSFQSKYLGMSPFRCPSLFSILSFLEYEYGVFHPIGGCGAVTATMAQIATKLGVDIRTNEGVEELAFAGNKCEGVYTNERFYECDALVINADFARAMHRLVPEKLRGRWSNRKLAKARYSCSTFMMYLGIRGRYDDIAHHSVYISGNYEENLLDIERRHTLSKDPSFYVQNACVTDGTLAPEGMSTVYALFPVSHQHENIDWEREKGGFRQLALQQLAKAGFKNLESRIVYEKIVTPREWDTQFELHLGSTFSLAHSLSQMLHLRPRNRFEDLESVYLVGGGTHPGSGLPVIFESSRISSRLLLQDLGMSPEFIHPKVDTLPMIAEVA